MNRYSFRDFIDARWILWGYAVFAASCGLTLALWGPEWFARPGQETTVRIFGLMLAALAPICVALAADEHALLRRKALALVTVSHCVIFATERLLHSFAWAHQGDEQLLAAFLLASGFLIVFQLDDLVAPVQSSIFSNDPSRGNSLHSRYEQQIHAIAAQQERARLARDLHDSVKQQIFAIQTSTAAAQERLSNDSSGAQQALAEVRDAARDAASELDAMLAQLQAEPLENVGFVEALKKQCDALQARTGASVSLQVDDLPPNRVLPPGTQQELFRIAQEGLSNVARHARAKHVNISVQAVLGKLTLRIQDDGQGFDLNYADRRLGLANMRSRAEQLGGTFEIISKPDGGTSIVVVTPYQTFDTPHQYLREALFSATAAVLFSVYLWVHHSVQPLHFFIPVSLLVIAKSLLAYRRAKQS